MCLYALPSAVCNYAMGSVKFCIFQALGHSPQTNKILYLSLVRSRLTYCSQIWRPHLLKDIITLEKIQHRATIYILNDFTSDYRSCLIALKILPLTMQVELYSVMFFIRNLKEPTNAFNIYDHVTFHTGSTHSSTHLKLKHVLSRTNSARHFYFNRMPRLWNSLPTTNLDQSTGSIKLRVQWSLWDHFIYSFKSDSPCTYHFMCPCSKCSCLSVMYSFGHQFLLMDLQYICLYHHHNIHPLLYSVL